MKQALCVLSGTVPPGETVPLQATLEQDARISKLWAAPMARADKGPEPAQPASVGELQADIEGLANKIGELNRISAQRRLTDQENDELETLAARHAALHKELQVEARAHAAAVREWRNRVGAHPWDDVILERLVFLETSNGDETEVLAPEGGAPILHYRDTVLGGYAPRGTQVTLRVRNDSEAPVTLHFQLLGLPYSEPDDEPDTQPSPSKED